MLAVNGARGEVAATLGDAQTRLCLTLGALAEIETALGVGAGAPLTERLRSLTAGDLTMILAALVRGGGQEAAQADAAARAATPSQAARAIADAFAAAAGA
jgi:hypothetical protein